MRKNILIAILVVMCVVSVGKGQIVVHDPCFVVVKLMNRLGGSVPRLEAIRNPDYGFGVMSAAVNNGILTVLHITHNSVTSFATRSGYPAISRTDNIRFDSTGLYDYRLYVNVGQDTDGDPHYEKTHILEIETDGTSYLKASLGNSSNEMSMIFDFTAGLGGYTPGAYLEDVLQTDGTSLYHMDTSFKLTKLSQNLLPSGRTDLDVRGMEFDPTGLYGNYLTLADSDANTDNWVVIYQLLPDLTWKELTPKVRSSQRHYRDMCFSPGGAFGQMLYVTDIVSDTVLTVKPNGVLDVFISGLDNPQSITVDNTGEFMYISDSDGIWLIRSHEGEFGPISTMQEPKVASDGVFTDPSGASSLRLLWNEPVIFTNSDVMIIDEDSNPISLSVDGINSQFMIIAFGQTLLNDKYTITIKDTVVSAETGNPIDGDNDGFAGGDAVIILEHRERHDSDNNNEINLLDFAKFALKWLWKK